MGICPGAIKGPTRGVVDVAVLGAPPDPAGRIGVLESHLPEGARAAPIARHVAVAVVLPIHGPWSSCAIAVSRTPEDRSYRKVNVLYLSLRPALCHACAAEKRPLGCAEKLRNSLKRLVPLAGLEPARPCGQQILSPPTEVSRSFPRSQ